MAVLATMPLRRSPIPDLPTPGADPWEGPFAYARAEVRDLIASGDLSYDEITVGWIETWAADLYAEEREAV